ncbi:MAG: hypothetical protein ABFC62_02140 [Clostridiaceae bacterium]
MAAPPSAAAASVSGFVRNDGPSVSPASIRKVKRAVIESKTEKA